MTTEITTEEAWKPTRSPWFATFAVMIATFIYVLDSTIANVALPHMAGSFSASNEEGMWILTSYMIASGIILPSVAWFSHVFGRKEFFIACICIFTFASVLCGMATSMEAMICARILQGLGGGAIMPIAQAIMLESFPREKRGLAMSIFGLGIMIAPVIGPVLGGWITDTYSWHWIFYINLPFGIISAIASKMFLENPPYAQKRGLKKIDYVGWGLLISWLVSLQIVLDKGQNADWFAAPWVCALSTISLLSMVGFILSQIHNDESIIDLSIFKDKNFSYGTVLLVIINGILYASIAILPLFLQSLLGYSAFTSGYATMPRGVGSLIGIVITGSLANIVDERILGIIGLCCLGAGGLMLGGLSLEISVINIVIPNLLIGLGIVLCFIPLTTLSMTTLSNSQMTNAAGVQSLFKNIGGAIGVSVVATMITRFSQAHQFSMVGYLNGLNPVFIYKLNAIKMGLAHFMHISVAEHKANFLMYGQLLQQSTLWAFIDAFRIFGLVALLIIPLIFFLDGHKKDPDSSETVIIH
jgi:DHA2 family multidrug resistance protein